MHFHSQQLAGLPARTHSVRNRTGLSQTPRLPNRPLHEPIMLMNPRQWPSPQTRGTIDQSATLKVHDSLDALAGLGGLLLGCGGCWLPVVLRWTVKKVIIESLWKEI